MGTNFDPLGFTKQTDILLRGVKAQDLIKEAKIRNISTDALHRLTKEDFVRLGANEEHATELVKNLQISKKPNVDIKSKPYHRISEKKEILKLGEKQLNIIQAYIAYCRFRLRTERINFFVEPDKALSASNILCFASNSILKEIKEAELKLNELSAVIMSANEQPRRYFYTLCCIPIGGLCIATCILFSRFWR